MKAVLLRYCPDIYLVDVTHEVPRHDILSGSFILERTISAFPPQTVHLAVVDPGVGTARRLLIMHVHEQTVVCPDNGLITWAWRRLASSAGSSPAKAFELKWRPDSYSDTFHGRDIMAPVAGMIAMGKPVADFAEPIIDPTLLDIYPALPDSIIARIIHIDAFGNATTNMDGSALQSREACRFGVGGRDLGRLLRTYADAPSGSPLALIGSSGLLEIAVRDGSAADQLNLRVGDIVTLE